MRTIEVLGFLKQRLESITPVIGRVHASLRVSPNLEDFVEDFKFKDPKRGDIIRAFLIKPSNSKSVRATTGRTGFSHKVQNFVIQGVISAGTKNENGPDLLLEDLFDSIEENLRQVSRLENVSQGDTFLKGEMDTTPIGVAQLGPHQVLAKELTVVVQYRKP